MASYDIDLICPWCQRDNGSTTIETGEMEGAFVALTLGLGVFATMKKEKHTCGGCAESYYVKYDKFSGPYITQY